LVDLLGLLLDILGACTAGSGDRPARTRPWSRWFWPLTATAVVLVIAAAIAIG
jgi:hypothetical protein